MDPIRVSDNGICFDDSLLSQDVDGEEPSMIVPRIGDEFQVQPPLHCPHYVSESVYHDFLVGLPLSLSWIRLGNEKPREECSSPRLVPESRVAEWSSDEKKIFLLALYIFEKDFIEIKRFLGTKGTGALLAYYYGKFYGSREYRRWSDCRKVKGKRGIYGRRLFSGLRQQELLSRILPSVSEDCRNALLEVSKAFSDEAMSFRDYVSSLKTMVGMNTLVEAVGIGTGKRDLTTMAAEPSRTSQMASSRPEMPTGKECSALTPPEIIKFLSGDYRLSKARSSDLFWEAVWPRLLARGWHSEQPKNQSGSKNCLVFLVPEIKKFSRRKLVKGDQYFDSVADVLSRVARDPGLIRLEDEDDSWTKPDDRDHAAVEKSSPSRQKPCFLQPRTPRRSGGGGSGNVAKFTVVDTSLSSDGKVRELRSLPFEFSAAAAARLSDEGSAESGTLDSENQKTRKKKIAKPPHKKAAKRIDDDGDDNYAAPVNKRRRVLSSSEGKPATALLQSCCSGTEISSCQLSSVGSSCKSSPRESVENAEARHVAIDLNLPQAEPGAEGSSMQVVGRQSRRNRPLTSRAMEALVNGYLTVNRRSDRAAQRSRMMVHREGSDQAAAGPCRCHEGDNAESVSG